MSYSFQKEFTLIPQSPLIHFQPELNGATLRATEVKPKLDRYIFKHCTNIPDDWKNRKTPTALNYKLRIICSEQKEPIPLGNRTYNIFYGNMGNGPKKMGIMAKAKLIVTSFNSDLLKYIDKIIGDFFIVTNFGTMQGKGFGSFVVERKNFSPEHICEELTKEYNAANCYKFSTCSQAVFKQIKTVYSLMKSGVNFRSYRHSILFDFMHEKFDMGNEKAWLKQNGIAPAIINKNGQKQKEIAPATGRSNGQKDRESRYVRALLGIADHNTYLNIPDEKVPDEKVEVTIQEKSGEISRLNSPVFFKVINNNVYYVGMKINREIFGKTFSFTATINEGKSIIGKGEINVPTESEVGKDFMDEFMHYAYEKINECKADFRDIENITIVEVQANGGNQTVHSRDNRSCI